MSSPATSHEERKNLLAPNVTRWRREDGPMIALQDIHIGFGDRKVLQGLNLEVHTGETTVVMGQSGSGKSLIIKLCAGLIQPDRGTVTVFGRNLAEVGLDEMLAIRKRIGMLFQNYALMDSIIVRDNIAFPISQNTTIDDDEVFARVRELLELLDLPHAYDRFPNELSGGMKKRVGLARALIGNPELVLFDEPTTGLDPVMIEFVDSLVIKARQAYNVTSLIISHDVASVYRLADKIAMLHDGEIVEFGPPAAIRASKHTWVNQFLGVGGSGRMTLDDSEKSTRQAPLCDRVQDRLAAETEEPIVHIVDLWKSFGDNTVLKGVNLKILPKKITVLIGGSGSGKSVIIKHIIGLFQPTKGQVHVFGKDIASGDEAHIISVREKFGMLFQGAALFDSMTVRANVCFPLVERRLANAKEIAERADEIMEQVKITDIGHRFPSEISNGQKKRVGLARAMIIRPEVMIYDEPTTGQDPIMIRYVDDMIEEAQETFDITSIVISHDMVSTFRIADRVAMLYKGQILAYGSPDELQQTQQEECQRFIYAGSFDD